MRPINASPTAKILWAAAQFYRAFDAGVPNDVMRAALTTATAGRTELTADEVTALVDGVIAKHRGEAC